MKAPAASICQAAATKLLAGRRVRRESRLPMVHDSAPASNAASASRRVLSPAMPLRSEGHSSAASPANPSPRPSQPRAGKRFAAGQKHLDQRDIERDDGEHQGGQAAGDGLFGIDQSDVAAAQEKQPDQAQQQHGPARPKQPQPAPAAPGQQQRPGDQKAGSGQQQGGHFGRADADGSECRAPEEIHAPERQHNRGRLDRRERASGLSLRNSSMGDYESIVAGAERSATRRFRPSSSGRGPPTSPSVHRNSMQLQRIHRGTRSYRNGRTSQTREIPHHKADAPLYASDPYSPRNLVHLCVFSLE